MTQKHHSLRVTDSRETVLPGDTLEKDTHSLSHTTYKQERIQNRKTIQLSFPPAPQQTVK